MEEIVEFGDTVVPIISGLTDVVLITPLMVAVCCGPKTRMISGPYTDQNPVNMIRN